MIMQHLGIGLILKLVRLPIIVFVGLALSTSARIRFGHTVEEFAFRATDIVVASVGQSLDGRVFIIDSWKGSLKPGDSILIPEFDYFRFRFPREVQCCGDFLVPMGQGQKNYVTGSRMILFLCKRSLPSTNQGGQGTSIPVMWTSAGTPQLIGGWGPPVRSTTIWIEGDESFAFEDAGELEPGILTYFKYSEKQIREKVIATIQKETLSK
jgi:hypothetical protein